MPITRYVVTVYSADRLDRINGTATEFKDKQKALDAAQAMSAPGSLSADPGDVIAVEEVLCIASFTKSMGDA